MARRHLEVWNGTWQIRREGVVRGRIDLDDERIDGLPHVVIDGRPVKWEAFGRMLLPFEGHPFKLEIYQLSEEIGDDLLDHGRSLMRKSRVRLWARNAAARIQKPPS